MLTSRQSISLILIGLVFLSIIYSLLPKDFKKKAEGYAVILAVAGIVFTIVTFYTQQVSSTAQTLAQRAESASVALDQRFASSYPYLAEMYSQMNPGLNLTLPEPHEIDPVKEQTLEAHMAFTIFQEMANVFHAVQSGLYWNWNLPLNSKWIRLWKTWFQSDLLKYYWSYFSTFFSPDFQTFVQDHIIGDEPTKPRLELVGYEIA